MNKFKFYISIFLLLVSVSCNQDNKKAPVSLSPENWGNEELEKFIEMDNRTFPDNPTAMGENGAITTTFHAAASRAGLEALKQGGSSVDAAMTAALTQITLNAGAVISFFGIMNMVHYDAATGEVVSMDATWNTVQNETDPMSIPATNTLSGDLFAEREVSGRTAMVGGFMKGVEAAHERYGELPFHTLFEPSIYLAERGFILSKATADFFKRRDKNIRRLPETKATLVKANGDGYRAGDIFKQPALANTLKNIAEQGSDYMYKGPWAEKVVEGIQADGGKMTLDDLSAYDVIWNDPIRASYDNYEVTVLGHPSNGAVNLIEALNLAYASKLNEKPHWSENEEALKTIADITNMYMLAYLPNETRKLIFPGIDLSDSSRLKMETSEALWERMQAGVKLAIPAEKGPKHSDTVVAIDQWGNITTITHSINCVVWGNEAIMVDGVSIGDAASFQQAQIAQVGPGNRLPAPIEIGIIFKDDHPILPFASMSMGLHQQTVQSILNVIVHGMDVEEAINAPSVFLPLLDATNPAATKYTIRTMEGAFPQSTLEESGLAYQEIPASERRYAQGLWIGIQLDPSSGILKAASPPYATGKALAY